MKSNTLKSILAGWLVIIMILVTVAPVYAENTQTPDISPWALETLVDTERYGIFPMEWYYDGFRDEISQERLGGLLTGTSIKLHLLGLDKKEGFKPIPYTNNRTRKDVITALYNLVARYELPYSIEASPVEYMVNRGIIDDTFVKAGLDTVCTTEEAVVIAGRLVKDTYGLLQSGSKGLAWKVEHNGKIIYFLGSIHVGSTDLYPVHTRLEKAFSEADVLLVEANILDQQSGLEYFSENSVYQDGTTLKDNINPEIYEKVVKVAEMFGIPEDIYNQQKPWSLANNLSLFNTTGSENIDQAADSANLGIDVYFLLKAYISQKPIYELEGLKYQTDMLDGLSPEYQEYYLNSVLDGILSNISSEKTNEKSSAPKINTANILLKIWIYQWIQGDIEGFSQFFSEVSAGSEDELSTLLFGQRDKDMADKIMEILESDEEGTYFVVVGAGHFVKENTIIHQLTQNGYNVEVLE